MPIKLAVFDMAGTTVYDDHAVADAFIAAFNAFDYDISSVNINYHMGYKKTLAINNVLTQIGIRPEDALTEKIHDQFIKQMMDHYTYSDDVRALPFAEDIFRELKAKGIKIALNTGFSREIADLITSRLGWKVGDLIDSYIASTEVEEGRPSPDMIRELMRRTGVSEPVDVVKVGDTEVDINEGRNAGCGLVIAVSSGSYTTEELTEFAPDFIIKDLSELPSLIADFE